MPVEPHAERVNSNVRAEMARAKRTQAALAHQIGMGQQALSRRLTGQTPFTVDELARVGQALGVSLADLVGGSTKKASA